MHPQPHPTVSTCIWYINILASTSFHIPIIYNYHLHLRRFREKAGTEKYSEITIIPWVLSNLKFFVNVIFGCCYPSQTSVLFLMVRWFSMHHTACDVPSPDLMRNTLYTTCQHLVYHKPHCMQRVNAWILEHFRRTRPEPYTVTTNYQ